MDAGADAGLLRGDQDHKLSALWVLFGMAGCRRGEALGLRRDDIDFAAGTVAIGRSLVRVKGKSVLGPTKTTNVRTIALDPSTLTALRKPLVRQAAERLEWNPNDGEYRDSSLLFCQEDGSALPPDSIPKQFVLRVKRAGLPAIRLHDLRHGHVSHLLASGVPVHVVSRRMGHADPTMTLRVDAHLLKGQDEDAAAGVGALIFSR